MLNNQIGMIEQFMSWKWFLLIHRYSIAEEYLQKSPRQKKQLCQQG